MLVEKFSTVVIFLGLIAIGFTTGCSGDGGGDDNGGDNSDLASLRRVTTDPSYDGEASVSPDGAWIAFCSFRGGGYRLWRIPFGGGNEEQLTTEYATSPRYSADGNYLYFRSNRSGDFATYRMPANGGAATMIVDIPGNAVISPDGMWFVYSSPDPGQFDPNHIWKRRFDLSQPAVKLTTSIWGDSYPAWSPSGDKIVFARYAPDYVYRHLYVINADGSGLSALSDTNKEVEDRSPAWSPDGLWIAFARGNDDHEERIFKVRVTGETALDPAIQLSFNPDAESDDTRPFWSPDGKWLVFDSNRADNTDVYVMSAAGEPQPGSSLVKSGIVNP